MKAPPYESEEPDMNVAALIDMTFLLLIYFMVSATLHRSEADLGIRLPGMVQQTQEVEMTDEQTIEIQKTGRIVLNGQEFDAPDNVDLPELIATLMRYRLASEASKNPPLVTIWAEDETLHQRVIDVMNACASADIRNVTFTASAE
jgi:biopolymer transport protein ExbD